MPEIDEIIHIFVHLSSIANIKEIILSYKNKKFILNKEYNEYLSYKYSFFYILPMYNNVIAQLICLNNKKN